jgi:hypothetical protein
VLAAEADFQDYYSDDTEPEAAASSPGTTIPVSAFFHDTDEEGEEVPKPKSVVKVPSDLAPIVKVRKGVEIVIDDAPYDLHKKPTTPTKVAKKSNAIVEEQAVNESGEVPDDAGDQRVGKKPGRDKTFTSVQHNRDRPGAVRPVRTRTEH